MNVVRTCLHAIICMYHSLVMVVVVVVAVMMNFLTGIYSTYTQNYSTFDMVCVCISIHVACKCPIYDCNCIIVR